MENIVIKRDGSKEAFDESKLKNVIDWACEGFNDLHKEELLTDANLKFKSNNTIKSKDILNNLTDTAISKISMIYPDWQFISSRLYLLQLFANMNIKDKKYPHLSQVLKKGTHYKVYDIEIINKYTDEEIDLINEFIDPSKDLNFSFNALKQFNKKYCKNYRKTKKLELPQITYIRVAMGICYNLGNEFNPKIPYTRLEIIKEFYEILTNGFATMATPIMINSCTHLNQFASCVLNTIGNDTWDLMNKLTTAGLYTKGRGGLAFDISYIQAKGSYTNNGVQTGGIIPFIRNIQSVVHSLMQSEHRRGSAVITCAWWHYEIESFLQLKDATSGTEENRALHLQYALATNDFLLNAVENDEEIYLFDPIDTPDLLNTYGKEWEDNYNKYVNKVGIRRKKVQAKELYNSYIKYSFQTGNEYETMLDNINRSNMSNQYVGSSNLCVTGDTKIRVKLDDGYERNIKIEDLETLFYKNEIIEVLSYNIKNNYSEFKKITNFAMTNSSAKVVNLKINNNSNINLKLTDDHKVYTKERGYTKSKYLKPTDTLILHKKNYVDNIIEPVSRFYPVYDITVEDNHNFFANDILIHNCQEIVQPSRPAELIKESIIVEDGEEYFITKYKNEEIGLCNLASFNCKIYDLPKEKRNKIIYIINLILDNTIDIGKYMRAAGEYSNKKNRFTGMGYNNYANFLASHKVKMESKEAQELTFKLFNEISNGIIYANTLLAEQLGRAPNYEVSKWAQGHLPYDFSNEILKEKFGHLYNEEEDKILRERISKYGVRNILMSAIAPTASSATSKDLTESIEPIMKYSYQLEGSVTTQVLVPQFKELNKYYSLAYEIPASKLIVLNAIRQMFIDQSQSFNLYISEDNWSYSEIIKMHLLAWKLGVKTIYYSNTPKIESDDECDSCSS